MGRINKEDAHFLLEENINYVPGQGNLFLTRKAHWTGSRRNDTTSLGGAQFDRAKGRWVVDVNAPYDEETDSDCRILSEHATQAEAAEALWNERHNIPR